LPGEAGDGCAGVTERASSSAASTDLVVGRSTAAVMDLVAIPIEAIQFPETQNAWKLRRNTIWHHFQTSRPLRHYADLKRLLDEYGDQLAGRINSAARPGPPSSRNTR
jgi:hypothetical protein